MKFKCAPELESIKPWLTRRVATARQEEQQKLFLRVGTLHRTRVNLLNTVALADNGMQAKHLLHSVAIIDKIIAKQEELMATISKRIPAATPDYVQEDLL